MIYHLLTEEEVFSEVYGGAISRWAANVLRGESNTTIVCRGADDTWGFPAESLLINPQISKYMSLRARRFYPIWLNKIILSSLLAPLTERLREGDVVWVHGNATFAMVLANLCSRRKVKLVVHHHAIPGEPAWYLRKLFKKVSRVVCCSNYIANEVIRRFAWPQSGIFVTLYNGADMNLFRPATIPSQREVPEILFVGRLTPEKGVHRLIQAMQVLEQRGVKATLRIIGTSFFGEAPVTPYVRSLEKMAPSCVFFEGYVTGAKLASRFRETDIYCCPSVWQEPLGMVNIEAMASGIPVVATRVGGIQELFVEGGAIMVAPDDPVALAEALELLIRDSLRRKSLGKEGYTSFLQHFTWQHVRARYHQILQSLG